MMNACASQLVAFHEEVTEEEVGETFTRFLMKLDALPPSDPRKLGV